MYIAHGTLQNLNPVYVFNIIPCTSLTPLLLHNHFYSQCVKCTKHFNAPGSQCLEHTFPYSLPDWCNICGGILLCQLSMVPN